MSLASMSEGYFVNGKGIGLEELRRRVGEHLGSDVDIEPSSYNGIQGYVLRATRSQTIELLNELVTQSGAISVGHLGHDASVVAVKRAVRNNSPTQDSGEGHHEDNPRTPASIRRFSSDNHRKTVNRSYRLDSCFISRGRMPLRSFVGPYRQTAPRYDTVVWSLIVLVIFFLSLCLAARFPTQSVRVVFVSISGFVFLILLVLASTDLMDQGDRKYIRNLGNTTLTVLLTIPLMTALYVLVWFPELNRRTVGVSQDCVTEARFPSVTFFQRLDWSAQAHILPADYSKCSLGWLEPTGTEPKCKDLPQTALFSGQTCNCSEDWSSPIVENFMWHNVAYRYLSFTPSAALVTGLPNYMMNLQVFFDYNVTFSLKTSSQEQAPSLLMAVYDPSLSLVEAFERDYTRMVLISANGDSSVNVGLQYRQEMARSPAYDYTVGISTVPNLNLVCDTASKGSYPCHITLFLQIPTFSRTTWRENWAMNWLDVAASMGGYFSFVQALSWLISGLAGAT